MLGGNEANLSAEKHGLAARLTIALQTAAFPAAEGQALCPGADEGGCCLQPPKSQAPVAAAACDLPLPAGPGRRAARCPGAGGDPQLQGHSQAVIRGWPQGAGGIFWRGRAAGKRSRPTKRGEMSGQVAVHASPIAAEVPQIILGGWKQHTSLCVVV